MATETHNYRVLENRVTGHRTRMILHDTAESLLMLFWLRRDPLVAGCTATALSRKSSPICNSIPKETLMFTLNQRTATGTLLLVFPFLIQIPYAILTATFHYPNILRDPADLILRQYAQGGPSLTVAWYLFAMAILPLLAGIVMLPGAVSPRRPRWMQAAMPLGVASAILQMLGLLRWVVLVPLLARAYVDPSATTAARDAIVVAFQAQHQLFGVMMGEYLGQILLALWTAGVVLSLDPDGALNRVQRWIGLASSSLFLIGSGESLGTVFPSLIVLGPLPAIAFLVWSIWCALLGWVVLRSGGARTVQAAVLLRRHPHPAAEIPVQDARLRKAKKE
jgi:hypothetical protein